MNFLLLITYKKIEIVLIKDESGGYLYMILLLN